MRHPIYVGIILYSFGLAAAFLVLDGLIFFPFIFLGHFIQAKIEEHYGVGRELSDDYSKYKQSVQMFGSVWFWAFGVVLGSVLILFSL